MSAPRKNTQEAAQSQESSQFTMEIAKALHRYGVAAHHVEAVLASL